MTFETHPSADGPVTMAADLPTPIADAGDFLDVLASSRAESLALHREQFHPEVFDLKTGRLGEILQKVSNYRKRLVILGDFSDVAPGPLRDFIRECNRGGPVRFAPKLEAAG